MFDWLKKPYITLPLLPQQVNNTALKIY